MTSALRQGFGTCSIWAGLALGVVPNLGASSFPPSVPARTVTEAPMTTVPRLGGSDVYQGSFTLAGAYVVETSTYDTVANQPVTTFTVRDAANHRPHYTLKPGTSFKGRADATVFSDGSLLALTLRHKPDGQVRVSVHRLSTGAHLFTLEQPDPKAGDAFGANVWFTRDRILVAAPGMDRGKENAGGLFVYNRTNGRLMTFTGAGVKNAHFGAPPSGQTAPYFQSSHAAALFVHGNRMFRFFQDQLQPLALPPEGTNSVRPADALISGGFVVVRTDERKANGSRTQGRVIGYDLAKRTVLYQLRAPIMKGGHDFPSGIAVAGDRLFVHDSSAEYPDATQRGAIGAYALGSGKPLSVRGFAQQQETYQDGRSFALSGGLLWIRTQGYSNDTTHWLGCEPGSLDLVRTLTPPYGDRFIREAGAPQALSGSRFGAVALRTESGWGWGAPASALLETSRSANDVSGASYTMVPSLPPNAPGYTVTTAGVLIYDTAASAWTSRLVLETEAASAYTSSVNRDTPLWISSGADRTVFRVARAGTATQLLGFDTVLPKPKPTVSLETRVSYVPQPGFAYEVLRQRSNETGFSVVRRLSHGDGLLHTEKFPFADYRDGARFRLQASEFSRRLSAPGTVPVSVGPWDTTRLAASRGDVVALRTLGSTYSPAQTPDGGSVQLIDVTDGRQIFTVYPSKGTGAGPVAFNDSYIVVGSPSASAGDVEVFDANSGSLVHTFSGESAFGSHLVLSGDLLATTVVTSTYQDDNYTHTPHIQVYDLTTGSLLHRIPLATQRSMTSEPSLPVVLVGAGARVAARGVEDGGSFADAGNVRVFDLASGEAVFTLVSPAPMASEHFGAWLAAGGDCLAVGVPGAGEVWVFSLTTGELRHALAIMERPSAAQVADSVLSINEAGTLLSWLVNPDLEANAFLNEGMAAYIFDLSTGLEEAKVLHPPMIDAYGGGVIKEVLFAGRGLWALTSQARLYDYDLVNALATPLRQTSRKLEPIPVVRLRFPARRGVSYQAEFSADDGATWVPLGPSYHGTGKPADLRLSLEDRGRPEKLRFRLKTSWPPFSPPGGIGPPSS